MQTLLLVRHAEIDNAAGRRFVGATDLPLTARGEGQARALASALAGPDPCPVFTSPLARARATAAALGAAGVVDGLREIHFGAWEMRLAEEVAQEEPAEYARWRAVDPSFAFRGGDALAEVARRAGEALAALWPREGGRSVIVAHGGVLRLGLCEALGLPWQAAPRLRLDFAGVSRLERHGDTVVLACLNDTRHLEAP